MFGIGSTELLVILVVALVVIGPSKLPEMAKTLGKAMGEFRRMSSDVKRTIEMEADREQRKPAPAREAENTVEKEQEPARAEEAEAAPDSVSGDRGEAAASAAPAPGKQAGSEDGEKA